MTHVHVQDFRCLLPRNKSTLNSQTRICNSLTTVVADLFTPNTVFSLKKVSFNLLSSLHGSQGSNPSKLAVHNIDDVLSALGDGRQFHNFVLGEVLAKELHQAGKVIPLN